MPRLFNELGFKVGAEVGVYTGAYTLSLLRYCPGLKLYGVDSWVKYGGYQGDNLSINAYEMAQENMKGFDCKLIKSLSNEAVKLFDDESLDFVFIDAGHSYESVVEDIALWSKKVRKGGIVYGHDFDDYSNHRRKWREINVVNAVEGWMKSYRVHPWFVLTKNNTKSWMYIK